MVGIPTGVISGLLHPPLGELSNHLDYNGPYGPGGHTLTTWDDNGTTRQINQTYGCLAIASGTIPPEWGREIGWDDPVTPFGGTYYEGRILQVVMQHALTFGLGGFVDTDIFDIYQTAKLMLWSEALPGRMGLWVAPGWSFDLQFLRPL